MSTACASPRGFPLSSTSTVASSSAFSSSRSARRQISRARRVGGGNRQSSKARWAASTAMPTSRGVASGASAKTSPVAGFSVGSVSSVSTNRPSMYRRSGSVRNGTFGSVKLGTRGHPLGSRTSCQLQDLPPEDRATAQGSERVLEPVELEPAGDRDAHRTSRRERERVLQVQARRGDGGDERGLGQDELDRVDLDRLVG